MEPTKCFVIDTNTLISAFILPHSTARKAVDKMRKEGSIILSEETANEFADVFVRPKFDKYIPLKLRLEVIDYFLSLVSFIKPEIKIAECRDAKDNKFLEVAVACNATCLVSGDKDLLTLHPFRTIPILSVADYLRLE